MRTFIWWFGMGCLTTLGVLMVQGGLHDLLSGSHPAGAHAALSTLVLTIFGGGILAGCVALILNRLR